LQGALLLELNDEVKADKWPVKILHCAHDKRRPEPAANDFKALLDSSEQMGNKVRKEVQKLIEEIRKK